MLNYSHCNMTVTVYNQFEENSKKIFKRTVIHNGAFLDFKTNYNNDKLGSTSKNNFLLVIPQLSDGKIFTAENSTVVGSYTMKNGTKVLLGAGEEIVSSQQWASMLPSNTQGLVIVKTVDIKYFQGQICHIEAGG